MHADFTILKALEERKRWRSLVGLVPRDMLVPDARAILDWFKVYYDTYPDKDRIQHDVLLSLIKTKVQLTQEQWIPLKSTIDRLAAYNDDRAVQGIVNNLLERDLAGRVGSILDRYELGGEVDFVQQVQHLVQSCKQQIDNSSVLDFIDTREVGKILEEEGTDHGLKLPTEALAGAVKGLTGGTLVGFGAAVDSGKTSFLCSALAHFAPQLETYFDADRPMLLLSNEGAGRRLVPRVYQAVLGKTTAELLEMSKAGTLLPAYDKAVGRRDRIRIKDIHGATLSQIETLIEESKACVVIIDMPANIRISTSGGNKTEGVERIWQTLRELAVLHDCVIIGTVQISAEGYDMLFPPMSALKDSKVGLQGALDVLLMLGKLNDPQMGGLRGLGTVKNKFPLPGQPSHVQAEVVFDPIKCQWSG
jgi:hypothetical protein